MTGLAEDLGSSDFDAVLGELQRRHLAQPSGVDVDLAADGIHKPDVSNTPDAVFLEFRNDFGEAVIIFSLPPKAPAALEEGRVSTQGASFR